MKEIAKTKIDIEINEIVDQLIKETIPTLAGDGKFQYQFITISEKVDNKDVTVIGEHDIELKRMIVKKLKSKPHNFEVTLKENGCIIICW